MQRMMLKSKIHSARLTATELHYEGSVGIDTQLMEAADILPGEQVLIVNVNNGSRIITYAIPEEAGSGAIVLNGAAARKGQTGDVVILMAFGMLADREASQFKPKVVYVDEKNKRKPV